MTQFYFYTQIMFYKERKVVMVIAEQRVTCPEDLLVGRGLHYVLKQNAAMD